MEAQENKRPCRANLREKRMEISGALLPADALHECDYNLSATPPRYIPTDLT
jgi:hypothetical protein